MNIDGTGEQQVVTDGIYANLGAWSPNGSQIVYRQMPGSNNDIVTANADGTGLVTIASSSYNEAQPYWGDIAPPQDSPSNIIYSSDEGGNDNIWTMNPDGSDKTQITIEGNNKRPMLSPDGTQIAFSSDRDGTIELWKMVSEGSNPVQLTTNMNGIMGISWSPGGTVFVSAQIVSFT
jgi:TolB protein